jgi:hypothetical protein
VNASRDSGLRRAGELASDLVIATALIWTPVLLLAAVAAGLKFLWESM